MKTYQCQKCDEIPCTLTINYSEIDPTVCPFDSTTKGDWEKIDDNEEISSQQDS
jgi:hypothetical protein